MIRPTSANAETRKMNDQERTELEAAAFRRLVQHLRTRPDAQNIDLMNLAGFCRNCLSKWYKAAADDLEVELTIDQAREEVYGMPYSEWKNAIRRKRPPSNRPLSTRHRKNDRPEGLPREPAQPQPRVQ